MGIIVILEGEDGREVRGLPDPAGGSFDAAGDFDRVLPEGDDSFAVLKLVDPDGDTVIGAGQMQDLLADMTTLLPSSSNRLSAVDSTDFAFWPSVAARIQSSASGLSATELRALEPLGGSSGRCFVCGR